MLTDLKEPLALEADEMRRALKFHRAVMKNMAEGLYTVDDQGLVTSMNRSAEKLFGWSFEELRGRKMHDMTHHHHRDGRPFPAEECAGLQVLKKGRTLSEYEDCFIRKDGTFFDVIYSSSPLREGGNITGLVVVFHDITERKRNEEALRGSEARFHLLADNISQLAWTCDALGNVTWYNRRWLEYTGLVFEDLQGWGWKRVHHPDHVDRVVEGVKRSGETGETWEDTFPLRGRDGLYRWFLSRAIPIRNGTGKVVQWFGTSTDITEQRQEEEKLERTVAQRTAKLLETVGDLEAFSYSIAHDMRAPLRAMQGFAQILVEEYADKIDEAGQGYLRRITMSAGRMDHLILDVLDYSRVVRAELPLEPIEVGRLLDGLLESYPMLFESKADIQVEGAIPKVLGNEAALTQVFSNLLGNAIKFVQPGVKPRVRIRAEEARFSSLSQNGQSSSDDWQVRLFVQDNGIGIPVEQQEKIFGIFQRVNKNSSGTGIGLAIVKKAAERMGGRAGVQSALGKGSTFWIELKRA